MPNDALEDAIKDLEEVLVKARGSATINTATLFLILIFDGQYLIPAHIRPKVPSLLALIVVVAIGAAICFVLAGILTSYSFSRRYGYYEALLKRAKLLQKDVPSSSPKQSPTANS